MRISQACYSLQSCLSKCRYTHDPRDVTMHGACQVGIWIRIEVAICLSDCTSQTEALNLSRCMGLGELQLQYSEQLYLLRT